jgi:hypothetical protein
MGILRGPSPQVQAAFAAARRDFGRLPGERAQVDLAEAMTTQPLDQIGAPQAVSEIGKFVSRIYFNPRFGTCSVLGGRF